MFRFSQLDKNWVVRAARHGSIHPMGAGKERFIVERLGKGSYSMHRGLTKAAALKNLLEEEGKLYDELKATSNCYLNEYGLEVLESLEDLFGEAKDEDK